MVSNSDPELERIRQQKLAQMRSKQTADATPKGGVLHLRESDFGKTISQGVTLVDFSAEWCGPCKMMAPAVEKLAQEFAGQAKVAKVDVDQDIALAMRYQVQGVPTFIIFKDGQPVRRIVGGVGYQALKAALAQAL
ncbi:MAG: thioredoxin [Promethearchaeota archaeon]